MERRRVFTGAPWERKVGYCRAVRAGNQIAVTGTVAVDDEGNPVAAGDGYGQARRCLEIVLTALAELDAGPEHVIRTRMFTTDIARWEEYGRAHGEVFGGHPPATTLVEVQALIAPGFLIEIEADAVVG